MKKIALAVLFTAAFSSALFAAGKKSGGVKFSNEVSSDVVHVFSPEYSDDDSHSRFAGITEEVIADYDGGVIKVGVDAVASFYNTNENNDDAPYKIEWTDADWYVEFNPFQMVGFGFSDELYTAGSYLPVWDDNVNAGNYSTNGFSVLIRPIDQFTFGAGFDFPADLFGDDKYYPGYKDAYNFVIGVDFNSDEIDVGGSIRHIGTDDRFQLGAYASLKMIDKLVLNFGFTHSEDGDAGLGDVDFVKGTYSYDLNGSGNADSITFSSGIYGENISTIGVSYEGKSFNLYADAAFNFGSEDERYGIPTTFYHTLGFYSAYDFYTAVKFVFGITDNLNLDIKGLLLYDFGDETVWVPGKRDWRSLGSTVGILPKIVFTTGKHTLSAGLMLQSCLDDDYGYTAFALPVSWKYEY